MLRTLALLLVLVPLAGCISQVQREHNTGLVAELGLGAAKRELKVVSARAHSPQIVQVEFNDVGFVYSYNNNAPMMWSLIPIQVKMSVIWRNLSRLDLYENNRVFLIGPNERELSAITFGNSSDAEDWVDLVLSLRADAISR